MHANSHVQFDTCTVSYTCQTVRHVHFDTRDTRVNCACHELHNLTRVLEYTCQTDFFEKQFQIVSHVYTYTWLNVCIYIYIYI